jgi:hypothetical protein
VAIAMPVCAETSSTESNADMLPARSSTSVRVASAFIGLQPVIEGRPYVTSRKGRLRQLFEEFTAHAIEPPFFHDVEIEIYADRFFEGQLPLPHVPNVGAV